jgi:hypothetical protein
MSNLRIIKKKHSTYLGEFLIESSQDEAWKQKMQALTLEGKLDTAIEGFPAEFVEAFPETADMNLQYCIERVELADVPRAAACWWPVDDATHYYVAYPAQFPQATLFMAIDFDDHSECCD